ncbi:MAG TPA: hypothetical protein VNX17_04695 [Edaphobacter sp.]|nr:hypothetical protein [Edaphobacter sp.]
MISTRNQNSFNRNSLFATLALLFALIPFAAAQAPLAGNPVAGIIAAGTRLDIPDSPGFLFNSSSSPADPDGASFDPGAKPVFKHSPHLHMVVLPGEIGDPMTVHDKVRGGLKNSVSLFSMTGWLASAGYEQLTNGSPNYGTDAGAFGQRLGVGAIHGISNGVFSNSLFAPIFHQDPRYYVMGPGHPFLKRLVYAATRSVISRTDSGRSIPNYALFAGNAAGAALTVTYYPAQNTTFSEVTRAFGTSLGGSAFGFIVNEFLVDALVDLHLKKKQQQP